MHMKEEHRCENKEPKQLYRIGMFANLCRTTIKTLRYYDEQNLIKPKSVDEETGYRYYELSQIAKVHRILALRNMDFSIEEIREILEGESDKDILIRKKSQILKEIAELTARLAQLESCLSAEKLDSQSLVLVKPLPRVTVAAMEKRLKSYDELFDYMPQMGEEMERLGCVCAEPGYCFTCYPEPGYKEEDIAVELCEAVTEAKENSNLLQFKVFPEVKEAACIFHKGSYDSFSSSYDKLLRFIEENGYEICGDIRESYIDGVWNNDSSEDWLSEIQIPVKKISG